MQIRDTERWKQTNLLSVDVVHRRRRRHFIIAVIKSPLALIQTRLNDIDDTKSWFRPHLARSTNNREWGIQGGSISRSRLRLSTSSNNFQATTTFRLKSSQPEVRGAVRRVSVRA